MAKIMLVEDDNNLREIYGARLLAEGHEIVAAQDGEEALALAVKEKPDLIISDVMMPRISGFDMLDILRNAPETKETKVIMMTALSQAEDKARADKLGADRYLVKSQVTLEDVANVVREVLDEGNTAEAPPADDATPELAAIITPEPTPAAAVAAPAPVSTPPQPAVVAAAPTSPQPAPQPATAEALAVAPAPAPDPTPVTELTPAPSIPEITSIPEAPVPQPATPATVEQIANPVVEMPDDSEATPVQVPPTPALSAADEESAALDALIHSGGSSTPEPIIVPEITMPVETPAPAEPAPVPAPAPVAEAPAIQLTPSTPPVQDLPPVVEPAAPIKVEMPTPLDGTNEQAVADAPTADQPVVAAPTTPVPAPDPTPVTAAPVVVEEPEPAAPAQDPSLAEVLAAEAEVPETPPNTPLPVAVEQPHVELPPASESDSPAPTIANGVALQPVIEPTEPPAAPTEPAPEEPATEADFESVVPESGGIKRVIQPLENHSPDINALLQAEEQKAAVANPVANTVISPTPAPVQQAPVAVQPPANDDVNNIAL